MTPEQIKRFVHNARRQVYLILDDDRKKEADKKKKAIMIEAARRGLKTAVLPDGFDPEKVALTACDEYSSRRKEMVSTVHLTYTEPVFKKVVDSYLDFPLTENEKKTCGFLTKENDRKQDTETDKAYWKRVEKEVSLLMKHPACQPFLEAIVSVVKKEFKS